MRGLALQLAAVAALSAHVISEEDPVANPLSVYSFERLRVTFLTSSLVRIELARNATSGWDDRATTTVVNRYLPPVTWTAKQVNATSVVVSTPDVSVSYTAEADMCAAQVGFQDHDGVRTPAYPNGTSVASAGECCAVCQGDASCTSWTFATNTSPPGKNCWPLAGHDTPPVPAPDRIFGSFSSGSVSATFLGANGEDVTWVPGTVDPANLNGTYTSLDCYTTPMQCNELYDTKMGQGLLSTAGWAAVDDTATGRFVPAPESPAGLPTWWSLDLVDSLDVYLHVFPGLDYRAALGRWATVLGRPAMLPRSAFGVWWSRYYRYSQETIVGEVLQGYANYSIPLNHLVLDMDWHNEPTDPTCQSWGNYDVNTTLFPDMPGFMQALHEDGVVVGNPLKLALNVHPQTGVDHCDSRYAAFAARLLWDTSANATIPCDFGNATFVDALYDVYWDADPLHGNDVWWTDYGGCGVSAGSPQLWNNRVVFDHMKYGREIRGQAFSRYGGLGNHRYPHGFSGDTFQHEVELYHQVKTTQTAANVLWGYWSHDIGGFHKDYNSSATDCPGDADPTNVTGSELLLRWIQWGAVAPLLRTHCDHCERRIWMFPFFPAMRDAMVLRNALGPYIYTAARAFYDSAVALVHPLYYDFGSDAAVFEPLVLQREYMFGDSVLASPITTMTGSLNASIEWSVYLPAGSWSNWNGTKTWAGPAQVSESYGHGDIPLFVSPARGGPLPLKTLGSVAEPFPDPLVWAVWPGAPWAGNATLYEDDGTSDAYQGGEFAVTPAAYSDSQGGALTLSVGPVQVTGALPPGFPSSRGHVLQVRGAALCSVASVTANGAPVPPGPGVPGWYVVAAANHSLASPEGSLVVQAGPGFAADEALTVVVKWGGANAAAAGGACQW